jgi:hypothetical protein
MNLFDAGTSRDMSGTVPFRPKGDGQGHTPLGVSPSVPPDGGARADPAAAYRDARARRAAYAAWEASGADIDDLPAGLLSACLHAAMTRPGKPGPRW